MPPEPGLRERLLTLAESLDADGDEHYAAKLVREAAEALPDGDCVADEVVGLFVEDVAEIISGGPFPSGQSLFKARLISDLALARYTPSPTPPQEAK